MFFQAVIPPGPAGTPETFYTGMRLGDAAPPDRPYVVCNFVASADGKATASGRTALLGGPGDREMFHLLRTQVDAVLAGTGTLRVERYGALTREPRFAEIRVAEGRPAQPLGVVISRSGHVPFDIPLFAGAESRVAVYAPSGLVVPPSSAQVTVHELPPGGDDLAGVLRSLRQDHGIRSLLCEGGPALFTALLDHNLVDELFLTVAPTIVGGNELGITDKPLGHLIQLRLVRALEHESTLFLRYARA
jgi:5-amino-6-(5-phosphoribosylamino)uracil reductase